MNTNQTSNLQTANSLKVYNEAVLNLGKNLCGNVNPEVGCAMTVSTIFKLALGNELAPTPSTAALYQELQDTTKFTKVATPTAGDIIISPTGSGNGTVEGHTGIVAYYGILANESSTGLLKEGDWTISSWIVNYAAKGALKVEFYRVK